MFLKSISDKIVQIVYRVGYRIMLLYWCLTRPRTRGAYVGLWHAGRILMIRNSYRGRYTVPSGKIKRNEPALAAAVRELAEEVGIRLAPEQLHLAGVFTVIHEFKKDHVSFYEVHLDHMPDVKQDNREVTWAGFLPMSEVKRLNLSPVVSEYFLKYARNSAS